MYQNGKKAAKKILKELDTVIKQKNLRFIQALYTLNILDDTDRYNETSEETVSRMSDKSFVFEGVITAKTNIEGEGTIDIVPFVLKDDEEFDSIAERIQDRIKFSEAQVELGFYIADTLDKVDLEEAYIHKHIIGDIDCDYEIRYSDVTGYLWTTEDLKIGGHDVIEELSNYVGYQCKLIINFHKIKNMITKSDYDNINKKLKTTDKQMKELISDKYIQQDYINQIGNVLSQIYHGTELMKTYSEDPMGTILECIRDLVNKEITKENFLKELKQAMREVINEQKAGI